MSLSFMGGKIRRHIVVVAVGLLTSVIAGCNSGAYPFDILPEMHYQQTSRIQEPARFYPPAGSVPRAGVTGPGYTSSEFAALQNPVVGGAQTLERGKRLFAVNCAPCHGPEGKGDGNLVQYFQKAGNRTPPSLVTFAAAPEGLIFGIITNGQGRAKEPFQDLPNMPNFSNLLTEDERWTIVHYVRSLR